MNRTLGGAREPLLVRFLGRGNSISQKESSQEKSVTFCLSDVEKMKLFWREMVNKLLRNLLECGVGVLAE